VLVTSGYALAEAERNLGQGPQRYRLEALVAAVEVVPEPAKAPLLPTPVELPESDRPILVAAIASACTHLLSGDRRAFGTYYGRTVGGVSILRPAEYLRAVDWP
jgi:hypothetical protein